MTTIGDFFPAQNGDSHPTLTPHPDYPSDEHNHYYMLLNKKGYSAYKQGKEIPLDCIRRESVETVKGEMKAE